MGYHHHHRRRHVTSPGVGSRRGGVRTRSLAATTAAWMGATDRHAKAILTEEEMEERKRGGDGGGGRGKGYSGWLTSVRC